VESVKGVESVVGARRRRAASNRLASLLHANSGNGRRRWWCWTSGEVDSMRMSMAQADRCKGKGSVEDADVNEGLWRGRNGDVEEEAAEIVV